MRRRSRCREEPPAQSEPVDRLECHILDVGQTECTGRGDAADREVNQPALHRPEQCQDTGDNHYPSGVDDHRAVVENGKLRLIQEDLANAFLNAPPRGRRTVQPCQPPLETRIMLRRRGLCAHSSSIQRTA